MIERLWWLNLSAIMLGICLLLFHRFAKSYILAQWRYGSYLGFWFLLSTIFIPFSFFPALSFPWPSLVGQASSQIVVSSSSQVAQNVSVFQDLSLNLIRLDWHFLYLVGFFIRLAMLLWDGVVLWRLYRRSQLIEKQGRIEIRQPIGFNEACSFGWIHPVIFLPTHFSLSKTQQELILSHEKAHIHFKHWLINLYLSIVVAVYWYNPFVAYMFKRFRLEQEMQCDQYVLIGKSEEEKRVYAQLLIQLASSKSMHLPSALSKNGKQMYKRLELLFFQPMPSFGKVVFVIFLVAGFLLVPVQGLGRNADYQTDLYLESIDLDSYFKEVEGCAVFYDSASDRYFAYHEQEVVKRISPNSTYKIYVALHALDADKLDAKDVVINPANVNYPFDSWNQPQNLNSAMHNSVNWYFQKIDSEFKRKDIVSFLKAIDYGNKAVNGRLSDYWLEGSLEISPLEQVIMLHKLDLNSWGYSAEDIDAVKASIHIQDNLYGKTGSGMVNGKQTGGWFIGYMTRPQGNLYFAFYAQHASGMTAFEIALSILEGEGLK